MSPEDDARALVAVVSAHDTDLVARLGAVTHPLRLRRFRDLYTDAEAIRRFRPAVLFLCGPGRRDEDAGALRLLRALLPDLGVVLVCEAASEVEYQRLAELAGCTVLVAPCSQGELTSTLDSALAARPRPSREAILDMARGISDEINNPLLFVGGHLQLLQRQLDPATQHPGLDQVRLIREGLSRISGTMDKLRLLVQAGHHLAALEPVDIGRLAGDVSRRRRAGRSPLLVAAPPHGVATVRGDGELLAALLDHLCRVAAELLGAGGDGRLEVAAEPGRVTVRVTLDARALPAWQLPRTFDPYYVTRVLRDTPHGLSLFLVQVIAQGHGGRALARWTHSGELALEIELPRSGG